MNLPFDILNPWVGVFLLLLAFLPVMGRRSLDSLSKGRRVGSLIMRGLIIVLVVAALADPRWQAESEKRALVYLVDVSRSVGANGISAYETLVAGHEADATFDTRAVVPFAGKSRVLGPGETLPDLIPSQFDDKATDLAGALHFAQTAIPPGYVVDVVAVTDGRAPIDFSREGKALADAGIRVHTVTAEPPDTPEVLVREVRAPKRVKESEPFTVEAEVVSNTETEADLKIMRNGVVARTQTVSLRPGVNRFTFDEAIESDRLTEFKIEVETAADTIVDNNENTALVHAEGKSKVLMVTDKPSQARYLARILMGEGILLDVRPAVGAPTTLSDLQNYDLLMIDNVPATDLKPAQLDLFAAYVRDFGGGFLMFGGDQSYGLGGYYRTPVEEILPVRCDYEKEKEDPSLGLIIVLDKSGSMNGEKIEMAKEAAKAAIELLSPTDYAGVVVFDGQAFWAAEVQPVVDKFGLIELVSTIQPGGGTNLGPAMELAYSQLSLTPAKLKHVILLTDGHSQAAPFDELTKRMVQDQITVSTVGVGQSADVTLLEDIARWGNGRFYFTEEARSIPQIFAKETMTASKSAIRELPFVPQEVRRAPFLEGVDFATAPFLYGYVATEAKPTAEVWLATEKAEPLLATWRFGLGNAGAFTSDARNRWAVEWLRWPGVGRFWAQTVRKLTRTASLEPFPVALQRTPGGYQLAVEAVDDRGEYVTGLQGKVQVIGPGGERFEVSLENGLPGRLNAMIETSVRGNYHLDIALEDAEGNPVNRQYLSAGVGFAEEFLLQPADTAGLSELASAAGGNHDATWEEIADTDGRKAVREIELWPWLVGIALGLFVFDVALKRWP